MTPKPAPTTSKPQAPPTTSKTPAKRFATEVVPCAFCRGKRTDPFGLLSWLSRCEVCHGEGKVTVPLPHVRCAFCSGSGSYKRFSCMVCKGRGALAPLRGPTKRCPECSGRAYETSSGLDCLRCRGRGQVAA